MNNKLKVLTISLFAIFGIATYLTTPASVLQAATGPELVPPTESVIPIFSGLILKGQLTVDANNDGLNDIQTDNFGRLQLFNHLLIDVNRDGINDFGTWSDGNMKFRNGVAIDANYDLNDDLTVSDSGGNVAIGTPATGTLPATKNRIRVMNDGVNNWIEILARGALSLISDTNIVIQSDNISLEPRVGSPATNVNLYGEMDITGGLETDRIGDFYTRQYDNTAPANSWDHQSGACASISDILISCYGGFTGGCDSHYCTVRGLTRLPANANYCDINVYNGTASVNEPFSLWVSCLDPNGTAGLRNTYDQYDLY